MPYCENCGTQINPNAKFCGNCGAAQTQTAATTNPPVNSPPTQPKRERLSYYSPPPANTYVPSPATPITQPTMTQAAPFTQPIQTPTPQVNDESTVGVIVFRKPKSLGRFDTYTGVLTTHRLIFAQMTSAMLNDIAQQSREQAKAEGKGFFGQWSEQLKATFSYARKYLNMSPEAVLAETPGNFAVYNSSISEVKVHLKGAHDENQRNELEVEFKSSQGTYVYRMDEDSDCVNILKRVYGERVKMPFGYFNKSINIKF
jgi:hypothetical protein